MIWNSDTSKRFVAATKDFIPSPAGRILIKNVIKHLVSKGLPKLAKKFEHFSRRSTYGAGTVRLAETNLVCHLCSHCFVDEMSSGKILCRECVKTKRGKQISKEQKNNKSRVTCLKRFGTERPAQNEGVKAKTKQTLKDRYGVDCALKIPRVARHVRKVFLEKYGAINPLSSAKVQRKCRRTLFANFGVSNAMLSSEISEHHKRQVRKSIAENGEAIKKKRRLFCKEKYGKPYATQDLGIRAQMSEAVQNSWNENKQSRLTKTKKTSNKRYGTDYPSQSKQVKATQEATCLERYGHRNPAWGTNTVRNRRHKYIVRVGRRKVYCEGYERFVIPRVAKLFEPSDIICNTEKGFPFLRTKSGNQYTPDIYVKSVKTYVEVKSSFMLTGKMGKCDFFSINQKRQSISNTSGVKLKFIVYHERSQKCVQLPSTWDTWSQKQVISFVNSKR